MIRSAITCITLLAAVGCGSNSPSSTSSRSSSTPADTTRAPSSSASTPTTGAPAAATQTPATGSPAAPDGAEKPGGAEGSQDDPRIEKIRARYQEIQSRRDLKRTDHRYECAGGEGRGELRLYQADGAIQKAEIAAGDAGHGEYTYQFYYDQGKLVFALHGDGSWAFDGRGTPDKPTTTTSVTQFRYYLHDGAPLRCIKKYAKGPSEEIESLLEKAPNQPDDCSRAAKAQRLASVALAGPKGTDELRKLLCN
ncbi:uncharacterized protein SOCE26_010170 [Sorangium cellulosum]|uniref:Uncharacterized protein n=1 Tax=Sorangium cellulosum TaxID=56 RepID=A0A2L0EJZ9_SORCE|nr:hypothetical protein [Sorangium cellulosum]AUX39623.1 uncharacterized protein SOCE26_010170 [Sorangium cellulosum]